MPAAFLLRPPNQKMFTPHPGPLQTIQEGDGRQGVPVRQSVKQNLDSGIHLLDPGQALPVLDLHKMQTPQRGQHFIVR